MRRHMALILRFEQRRCKTQAVCIILAASPGRANSAMRKQTMGRPSIFSDELAAEICERLASGESLNAICRDEHIPTRQAVHEWIADNRAGFGDKYARARAAQADHYADEIIEIVDTETDPVRA